MIELTGHQERLTIMVGESDRTIEHLVAEGIITIDDVGVVRFIGRRAAEE